MAQAAKIQTNPSDVAHDTHQAVTPEKRPDYVSGNMPGHVGSPVADLHTSIEKAYRARDMARSQIEPIPFAIGLTGMLSFAALFWYGVAKALGLF